MCFYIPRRWKTAKKATEDIPVKKLVKQVYKSDHMTPVIGKYASWHRHFEYEDGYEYRNTLFRKDVLRYPKISSSYFPTVRKGTKEGIHSFSETNNTIRERFGQIIIECYIPKGAYYFYNKSHKEYFSNRLVVVGRK